jgi:hypothetical protein
MDGRRRWFFSFGWPAAALKVHCRNCSIEPPTPDRIERIVRAATHAYEELFCQSIRDRLPPGTRARLEALLQPQDPEIEVDEAVELSPSASATINLLRDDPGRASVKSLHQEMTRLDLIRRLELPPDLFDHTPTQELERYRQRVAVEASFELRRHPEPLRLTWIAAFAYVRGRRAGRSRPGRQSQAGYEGAGTCRAARDLPRSGWRLA